MPKAPVHAFQARETGSSTTVVDKGLLLPLAACVYALIVSPLLLLSCTDTACLFAPKLEHRIFWPTAAAIAVILALRHRSRLTFPPHIICLFGYLALAASSVVWAFNPEVAFTRFSQQAMIIISIVLPVIVANEKADILRGLFFCFACASILSLFFVLLKPLSLKEADFGNPGYFHGKNYLGVCATVAILLSFHEMRFGGLRRVSGVFIMFVAGLLTYFSNSKTALGLSLIAPALATLTLIAKKHTRLSVAVILLAIPFCYVVLSSIIPGFNLNRLSYMIYGDSTFTGRTIIWDFARLEIARKPLLGWGYQSFWLAGPDAPSILNAPGWVKTMPNAHNGYYDTMIELGYVGFALLMAFIIGTLHAIGRVAGRDPRRAWLMLSLAIYIILYNFLESLWARGFEFLWVVFLVVAAEAARDRRQASSTERAYTSKLQGRAVRVSQRSR